MNCSVCPHMKRIKSALGPCANCEAGKLHGQFHVDERTVDWATGKFQRPIRTTEDSDRASLHSTITNLSPDDEDALRKAMSSLFALDPMELLMVQHIMRGGSYASFAGPLLRIYRRLRTKESELQGRKDGFRQLAKTWADAIEIKMPQMRPVLRARIVS